MTRRNQYPPKMPVQCGQAIRLCLVVLLTLLMTFGTLPLDVVLADEEPEHQEQVQQADQADVPAAAEEELAGESSQPEQETAPPAPETTAEPSQGNVGEPPVTEAPTSESEKVVALTYEDEDLVACVEAPESVLRGCVGLVVEEVVPVDEKSADAYAEALTGLSEMLREEGRSYTSATVYDIRLLDASGDEIEPAGQVDVTLSFKRAIPLAEDEVIAQADAQNAATPDDVDVAHLDDEGNATAMGADMTTNNDGELEEAAFATDSFSYYIVFGSNAGSESEPANIGDYGWIRFQTPDSHDNWGTYNPPRVPLPALGSNDAFRRIMQVRLWNVKPGGDESSHDPDNYDLVTDTMYYWTWENQIYIEEFDLPNHEVLWTQMHTAWDDPANDVGNDSLIDTYRVRGYQSATQDSSDLNVLDIYVKPAPKHRQDMRYIVRYIHADGSISDGNLRIVPPGGSPVTFAASDHQRDGEVYSGMSIISGVDALSNIDEEHGSATISFNEQVDLTKVYVYYKQAPTNDGNPTTHGTYDYENGKYYTGEMGLYTEKNTTPIGDGETRDFMINLESWYVGTPASVGMVLDASGSMAWTAGTPTPIQHTDAEWDQIFGNRNWRNTWYAGSSNYTALSDNDVLTLQRKGVLDPYRCDNSSMGYNGYHYYIYSNRATVSEYVALGYTDGSTRSFNLNVPNQYVTGSVTCYVLGDNEGYSLQNRPGGAGWYYVNSSGNTDRYHTITGKSYDGIATGGASKFYIDGQGRLCCIFSDGRQHEDGSAGGNGPVYNTSSPVYEKRETMLTKNETLQDAVAQFGSILLGYSPTSQIAMTRFSQNVENRTERFRNTSYLPLLNWTSETTDVADALDLTSGSTGRTTRANPSGPVPEYLYGLTGQTRTWTGVQAYMDHFQRTADGQNNKYLIIFTDGKDTNGDADQTGTWGATGTRVQQLKNQGYTVITVLMKSASMEASGEYASAAAFLQGLASGGKDGDPNKKLYFEADSNSSHDMVEQFRDIAEHIATGLYDYAVRDYIDPRYDVVNDAGLVLSVLDENGNFTEGVETSGEYRGFRMFTSADGKQALLGYDSQRKMFYVLWPHQDIPVTPRGSQTLVNTWHGQVRVRAKEDFIGGNDVLTNGNEPELNSVYKPANGNFTQIDKSNPTQRPYKDFPMATANPATLDVSLMNYEDTVFLGEDVSPYALYQHVAQQGTTGDGTQWYIEYLERFGIKKHNDADYYADILKGGNAGTAAPNETVTITDDTITIRLPYYYLDAGEVINDHRIYAGSDARHQADQVGWLTYTWKKVQNNNADAADDYFEDFTTDVTDDIRYELTVKYEPLPVGNAASGDNGSTRTNVLTETTNGSRYKDSHGRTVGTHNELVRNAVGVVAATRETSDEEGIAVVHVVDGRVCVVKRVRKDEFDKMVLCARQNGVTEFVFTLTGPNGTTPQTVTIPVPTSSDGLEEDGDYYIIGSEWVTGLEQGIWTLTEETPEGFEAPSFAAGTYTGTDEPTAAYNSSAANFAATPTAAASSVSWNIGVTPDVSTPFYPTSDFSYQQVTDTTGAYKGVDRTQDANAKPYLNAQIGEAVITNVPGEIVYALPSAGGPGAYPFLLVGAFVATYALGGVRDGRRRNRAGQRKRGIS